MMSVHAQIFSWLKLQVQEPLYAESKSVYPVWLPQCKKYSYDEDKCFNLFFFFSFKR